MPSCWPLVGRLIVGKSLLLRRVVPILGVPDALVPLDLPVGQINLNPGYTPDCLISIYISFSFLCRLHKMLDDYYISLHWYYSGRLLLFGFLLMFQVINLLDNMKEKFSLLLQKQMQSEPFSFNNFFVSDFVLQILVHNLSLSTSTTIQIFCSKFKQGWETSIV